MQYAVVSLHRCFLFVFFCKEWYIVWIGNQDSLSSIIFPSTNWLLCYSFAFLYIVYRAYSTSNISCNYLRVQYLCFITVISCDLIGLKIFIDYLFCIKKSLFGMARYIHIGSSSIAMKVIEKGIAYEIMYWILRIIGYKYFSPRTPTLHPPSFKNILQFRLDTSHMVVLNQWRLFLP